MGNFEAKIPANERPPRQQLYYAERATVLEIRVVHFVHDASACMNHDPLLSPSYDIWHVDFETTPGKRKRRKKKQNCRKFGEFEQKKNEEKSTLLVIKLRVRN